MRSDQEKYGLCIDHPKYNPNWKNESKAPTPTLEECANFLKELKRQIKNKRAFNEAKRLLKKGKLYPITNYFIVVPKSNSFKK